MRFIIVTGGDEKYAPLVLDAVLSLTRLRPQLKFDLGCLDYGFLPATREAMARSFDHIVSPDWPFRPHAQFDKQIQARAFATRPFLPDYFPGYDAYAWLDADSFVQDPRGVALLAACCDHGLAGVVPTVDRSYQHTRETSAWVMERYKMAFGRDAAARMAAGPYINSGVVSASCASPMWKMWQARFQQALDHWDGPRLCDQAVLNHVVYLENLPHHKLPASCNWICHLAMPVADVKRAVLVEPSYPNDPIYIVANTFNDKRSPHRLKRLDGGELIAPLTFEGSRNAMLAAQSRAQ